MTDNRPTQHDLESRWITAEGIPGVNYRYGDIIRIITGDHAGEDAEVIALLSINPEPKYGVRFWPNEEFLWVSQCDVQSTGSNSGGRLTLMKHGEPTRSSEPR